MKLTIELDPGDMPQAQIIINGLIDLFGADVKTLSPPSIIAQVNEHNIDKVALELSSLMAPGFPGIAFEPTQVVQAIFAAHLMHVQSTKKTNELYTILLAR